MCAMLCAGLAGTLVAATARADQAAADLAADLGAALDGAVASAANGAGAQTAGSGDPCPGDCDGNGVVSVDEMIRGVVIAAGAFPVSMCPAFDTDGSGSVTINELIAGIRRAIEGCSGTGAESVCGGPITSTPKLCNLQIEPMRVVTGGTVNISFGMSDLEGDIVTICLGIARIGGSGMQQCNPVEPVGQTINLIAESPGIPVNLATGDYEMALMIIDANDARSEIITARFTVFFIRR